MKIYVMIVLGVSDNFVHFEIPYFYCFQSLSFHSPVYRACVHLILCMWYKISELGAAGGNPPNTYKIMMEAQIYDGNLLHWVQKGGERSEPPFL